MNNNDKFNLLYNEIKILRQKIDIITVNKNDEIEKIKNKMKEMDLNLNKKSEEIDSIKQSIEEKKLIINKQNEILIRQDNQIKEINNKLIEKENQIAVISNKLEEKEVVINNLDIILKNKEINDNEINNQMKNIINEVNNDLNLKYNELINLISNLEHNEFIRKINYKFEKDPQDLKFRQNINDTNASYGWNDIFVCFSRSGCSNDECVNWVIHVNFNVTLVFGHFTANKHAVFRPANCAPCVIQKLLLGFQFFFCHPM